MAVSVGDAVLKLGVDTKELDKGLQSLGNKIKQHQKAIGLAMAAAGGAILAAGVLSVKTYAKMGDEVHKMALRTGFATESLSRLKYAAEIGGASLETIEKAAKRMSMAILDAKDGLAETIRAFDHIGVAIEDLEGLSPEDQFMVLAGALADVEDATLRAGLAQKIFGRAGTAMLPMLAQGTAGLKEMMAEAEKFAPIFDQQAAEAAAKLTDQMGQLGGAFTKVKLVIAQQLVPILIPLIDKIRDAVAGISKWAKENPVLTRAIVIGTLAFGGLLLVLGSLLLLLPTLTAGVGIATGAIATMTGVTIGLNMATLALVGTFSLLLAGLGMVAYGIWQVVQQRKAEAEWTKTNLDMTRAYIQAKMGEVQVYAMLLQARINDLKMRVTSGKATQEEIRWLTEHGKAAEEWIQHTKLETAVIQEQGDAWEISGGQAITAIQGTQEVSETAMASVTESAISSILKVAGIKPSLEEQRRRTGGLPGGTPGGWAGFGEYTRGMLQAGFTDIRDYEKSKGDGGIPELQHGGLITRPTLAMLGEAGPEAVIPLGRGASPLSISIAGDVNVRSEEDINTLARRVSEAVGLELSQRQRIRG